MTPVSDLIARLEMAKEGSRELGDACLLAAGWRCIESHGDFANNTWVDPNGAAWDGEDTIIGEIRRPNPTISLDAALTLVPKGWHWNAGTDPKADRVGNYCQLFQTGTNIAEDAWFAGSPALAVCIAALKAREVRR